MWYSFPLIECRAMADTHKPRRDAGDDTRSTAHHRPSIRHRSAGVTLFI